MTKFRLMLLSTAAAGLVAAAVSPASAGEVTKSMSVSGHINRVIILSDNGNGTTLGQADNAGVSESRFRIKGAAKSEAMTISTLVELGVTGNNSLSSQANADTSRIRIRHSVISVANNMGKLSVGQTWAADWLATSSNLSGTGNAGFHDGQTIGGEALNVNGNTGTAASGVSVGGVLPAFTGYRKNLIKYVTPNMNGFTGEASFAAADHAAASLRYSGDFNGTKVAGTAAWGSRAAAANKSEAGGSLAVALAGGLNGSVAYSRRNLNGNVAANAGLNNPEMWGAGIGYTMGANGVTAWYQAVNDLGANNNKAKTYALVAEHKMADYGTSVYGGIQRVTYDTTAIKYDDLTAGWVGIKVTF